ncbi:hypothetical protein C2E21_5439 [Chlorella sorokiniana]|uniref:Uncharacterized protein n=1 Tax=Chlorella sorokiniana TaxID=3076 RepID=A0A2P6TNA2_CHLSO|nr:hypothetical protein C2E21_5439 [Chlorella sorokiniana]|eukprot:PRW50814.1 hypothetical protein C2E21_5439 [Chlorella sorokiniana]
MSQEEVVVEAPPAEQPEAASAEAAAEAPEQPKLPPGMRIKKPVRPDDTETKAAIDVLQGSIVKNKRRIEEIKELIDNKRSGRSKGSSEQQALKSKLAEMRTQFQQLVSQKQQLRQQLEVASKARENARSSMKELRSSVKFTKVEDIDTHIAELEHRISHDSLSLNEEKKVLEQIKALKKSRSTIGELTSKVSQLEADSSAVDGLRDGIKGIDEAINKIKAQEEGLRQQLADLRAKEAEQGSDIPALIQERDECREVCKAAYQKIQDLRAELDAQWAAYKEQNALFRVQLQEDKKKRQEDYLKHKAERDAERAARIAENAPEPFDREVTMCDQLSAYLRKFVVAAEKAAEVEKRDLSDALEGFKPMQKKSIDEEDAWLLGGGKGKGKGKGKAAKKTEEKKAGGPEKLTHSLDILEAFATLKLEVPLFSDKCEALLAAVAEKKDYFLQRRKEVKEAPPAEEPAANGEAEAAEKEGEEAAAAEDKPKAKKGPKAAAPPKLDDAASWPSIGGAVAPAAAKAAEAEEEAEPAEEEAEEEAEPAEEEAEAEAAEDEPAAAAKEAKEEEPAAAAADEKEEETAAAAEPEAEAEAAEEEAAAPAEAAEAAAPADGRVSVKLEVAADGSLAILLLSIRHVSRRETQPQPAALAGGGAGGGGGADAGSGDAASAAAAAASWPVTSDLSEWVQLPYAYTLKVPQSQCLLHPDGRVELPPGHDSHDRPAFLWDTASMPDRGTACAHCDPNQRPPLCCGVCVFEGRRCDALYLGEGRSEAVAQHLLDSGYRIKDMSPCELFARIRGRTLWFMGDSQTWHYYYSAECFLREFAPSLRRTTAVAAQDNNRLITVTWPVPVPPMCLPLALGTRVCVVRVDSAEALYKTVLPLLQQLAPNFQKDVMIFNTGLHYPTPGADGRPMTDSNLYRHMASLADWRQQHAAHLPKIIWMDAPVQHFSGPDGTYHGGQKPFRCAPLKAWYARDAMTLAGGRRNVALSPLIPRLADAHLRTWNASVPLWATHKPDECTHWCSPSAYHIWLYLLNNLLRDSALGSNVSVAQRSAEQAATEAAAVEKAEAAAAAGAGGGLHLFTVGEPGS